MATQWKEARKTKKASNKTNTFTQTPWKESKIAFNKDKKEHRISQDQTWQKEAMKKWHCILNRNKQQLENLNGLKRKTMGNKRNHINYSKFFVAKINIEQNKAHENNESSTNTEIKSKIIASPLSLKKCNLEGRTLQVQSGNAM